MSQEIKPCYVRKTAYVYLRQSSPGQVKRNVEGQRRQRRMQEFVQELGWPQSNVCVLGGDMGQSGGSLHGRDDYQAILEGVMAGKAGAVVARELSRLARDNQDWNQLVRLCRYQDVLLIDEHRVYDASNPQDRVVLGVTGAFNEFELSMIVDRMLQSRLQKAGRGELYESIATGYVCRIEPVFEKHPDERVRRAVEKVFDHFDRCTSVLQAHGQLVAEGFKLPMVPRCRNWREIQWRVPSYGQLLYMLKNPVYAGFYVRGRKRTLAVLDEVGQVKKQRRCVPREQWDVFLSNHHEAYISAERWERNLERIASNTRGGGMKRAPQEKSKSLLTGLLRCRRCGSKLQAQYPKGQVRYMCRGGLKQRERPGKTCFSFTGAAVEQHVAELILEVVRPAGIDAARAAGQRFSDDRQQRRQLIVDRVEACREAEARGAREYKATDATYTSVRHRLADEWEEAIAALQAEESRLAVFDSQSAARPTEKQQRALDRLSKDVDRIWHDQGTTAALKKQIVRTLIEEIVVDIDDDEIDLCIHWTGGHHTSLRQPRRVRPPDGKSIELSEIVNTLRKVLSDGAIARILNREGFRIGPDETWTAQRVTAFRRSHGIAGFSEKAKQSGGWLTQSEAANWLSISSMSVTRLVTRGVLPAERPSSRLPAVVQQVDLDLPQVKQAVDAIKTSHNRPLTHDPSQQNLPFPESF